MRRIHTKETIAASLQDLSRRLGRDSLSQRDVEEHLSGQVPPSVIRYHFGSLKTAAEAAGITWVRDKPQRSRTSDDELFADLLTVEGQVGHAPGSTEYGARGRFSTKPFKDRFGPWARVVETYQEWKNARSETRPEPEHSPGSRPGPAVARASGPALRGEYGEIIDFRGLRHAPTCELGVVYLFGMVSRELGFEIEAISPAFPDCEGKYNADGRGKRWRRAYIEFEYKASGFREHVNRDEQCDFVVCWENDWPDCPVEVIELREGIRRLPQRVGVQP
jgi:hypothetical protein